MKCPFLKTKTIENKTSGINASFRNYTEENETFQKCIKHKCQAWDGDDCRLCSIDT
jgi:hypothetical protein